MKIEGDDNDEEGGYPSIEWQSSRWKGKEKRVMDQYLERRRTREKEGKDRAHL